MPGSFRALENETFGLYESGKYRDALDLLDAQSGEFTELGHRCKIAFFRACLLARSGSPDAALDVLETGVSEGLWWSPEMLDDSDLDPCRGERRNRIIEQSRGQVAPPSCLVDDAGPAAPVLLALHGGGVCVTEHDNPWAAARSVGWTICRPISSQRRGAGLATWTNLDDAVEECRTHLDRIERIDAIGSFSLGGSLALRLITEVVDVPVVMVAPSLRESVVANIARGASTAQVDITTGQHDPFLESTRTGVAQLQDAGADVRLEIVPGVAHDFPPDFDQRLTGLLARRT